MGSKKKFKWKKLLRSMHALLGILVIIPLLIFTITGVLLNHKSHFSLDDKHIKSEWVMSQYGLDFSETPKAWKLGKNGFFTKWANQFVLNGKKVELNVDPHSAIEVANGFCIASKESIYYFDTQGLLVEVLGTGLSLPEGEILNIGVDVKGLLIIEYREQCYKADNSDLISFKPVKKDQCKHWSIEKQLTKQDLQRSKEAIIDSGQPLDRVILDIHSGNIFPLVGMILVDLFALGILGLSISGCFLIKRKWKLG